MPEATPSSTTHAPIALEAKGRLARVAAALIAFVAALFLLTSCEEMPGEPPELTEPTEASEAGDTWTVLLYLCGSDLESRAGLATNNLLELLGADLGENVTFVVETGGTQKWWNNVVTSKKIERYHTSNRQLEFVDDTPSASMGEASTLTDFITWATKEYPAERTMLIFWDHGGGTLSGVCSDELYAVGNERDTLTLPEMKKALAAANHKFDIIGFDTCLMATLETAETVAPWGDYLVASEETEPGGGWAYAAWPAWLARYPGMSTEDLARGICDSYLDKCTTTHTANMATLSATDLSKIPALSEAFRKASSQIVLATGNADSFRLLTQGASRAESYGGNTMAEGFTDMVDLGDLMQNTSEVIGQPAHEVLDALDQAVIYSVNGRDRARAQGLSVFYPLALNKDIYNRYAAITDNTSYLQYLAVLNGDYQALEWDGQGAAQEENLDPLTTEDVSIQAVQRVDSDGHLRLTFSSGVEFVESVRFELGFFNADDSVYLPLGTDNNLYGDWDTGIFADAFEGTWLAIDGNFVNAHLMEEGDSYNLYTIPIMLNGERSNLKVAWRYDVNRFEVIGVYDGIDETNGMSGKSMRPLEEGDEVAFLFSAVDIATGDAEEIELATISWNDGLTVEDTELSDGLYLYRFQIVDVFGNTTYSDPVFMLYENGAVSVQEVS